MTLVLCFLAGLILGIWLWLSDFVGEYLFDLWSDVRYRPRRLDSNIEMVVPVHVFEAIMKHKGATL